MSVTSTLWTEWKSWSNTKDSRYSINFFPETQVWCACSEWTPTVDFVPQVAPAELEALLLTNPKIADAAVIGIPDLEAGELPKAYVVLKPGISASVKEVQKFVADKVSRFKHLRGGVEFVQSIPKSPSGKILRKVLREMVKKSKL